MKAKKNQIIYAITFIFILVSIVVMYVTHRAVAIPLTTDDLWYATMLFSEEPITSLGDIIESQIWHYFNWGGRSITHGMLQLTLLAGEGICDILNVLMTILLAGMICVTVGVKKSDGRLFAFFAAIGMLFGLNANWKMSMFWQAGAANYLYITVFLLLFLWCYLREVTNGGGNSKIGCSETEPKNLPAICLWIIPLGIVAGWSNENMGPAVWIISLLVILLRIREKQKIKLWMVSGNLSCLFGSIMVVVAPGNFVRSAQVAENEYGLLWKCFLRAASESKAALEYLFPAVLLLMCLLFISKGILKLTIGRENLLLLLGAVLSWGAMFLSPHYPDRATFGTMVLLICVIISTACKIYRERKECGWMLWGISVFIWLRGMYFLGDYLAVIWGWIK